MASPYSTNSPADEGGGTAITAVHPDIIQTHVLARLDGPTLASAACVSPLLHALCTEEKFWRDICNSRWNSVNHPRVRHVISTFPAGYRSFFSDSFPTLHHDKPNHRNHDRPSPTSELISAVDIRYQHKLVYSKVEVTETRSDSFRHSTFWVDLLRPKETVPMPVKFKNDDKTFLSHLERYMTLSWILIDPTRKRAANISSLNPVLVRRHWLTGEVQLRYAKILAGDIRIGSSEMVQCRVEVTCVVKEGGELEMKQVNLQVQDMEKRCLSEKDSWVILQEAMVSGRREKGKRGKEKETYEKYREMKKEKREKEERSERRLGLLWKIIRIKIFLGLFLWYFGLLSWV